jgi:hypothetical protein
VGLRKLLTRRPAEYPLERFVDLGGAQADPHPIRQFAEMKTQAPAEPIRPVAFGKESSSESADDLAAAKRRAEPPRSRSGYFWVSQRSRNRRTGWADFVNRTF